MSKKKLCIITGSRADWGILYPLAKEIRENRKRFTLQIVATGAHLESDYGLTYKEIERDGFKICDKVNISISGDTTDDILQSVSLGILKIRESLKKLKPALVFLLGDRFEIYSAAIACMFSKIPIAHIHGGEITEGSLDDTIRHSITKIAYLHFVSTEVYRKRVIQMGESPLRVFNVGALGVDNIKNTKLLSIKGLEEKLRFKFAKKNIIVNFNPSTSEEERASETQLKNLLEVIAGLKDTKVIFTMPNPDMYSKTISNIIDGYIVKNRDRCVCFRSLGRLLYLSSLQFVDIVAGNSSSGIIEAPSFGIPTINIGNRQRGRIYPFSVINTDGKVSSIKKAFKRSFSVDFCRCCRRVINPYGRGDSAKRIINILKKITFEFRLKKFFDIKYSKKFF